jgi:hypothetical protein
MYDQVSIAMSFHSDCSLRMCRRLARLSDGGYGSTSAYRNWNVNTGEPTYSENNEYSTAINWRYARGDATAIGTWNDAPLNGSVGYGGNTNGPYYGIAEHLAVSFGRLFNRLQRADP